jgi:hypothetical protein
MKSRWVVLAIGLAALIIVAVLLKGKPKEEAWSLEGRAVTADTCVVGCPCILGEPPTHGTCQFVGIFHVEKGAYGKASLDNVNFAVAGAFSRSAEQSKQTYRYIAYYFDSNANSAQKRALRRILTGPAFEQLGKPAEVKDMPITLAGLDTFGEVGKTCAGSVGDIAKVEVTPIEGAVAGQPMVVTNSAEPMFNWTALGKASGSFYRAAGQNFKFDGTSGESHKFSFSGGPRQ